MPVTITPFLRNSFLLDAVASGATGLLMLAGGSLVASLTGLPQPLLFWAGVSLMPFVALLVHVSRQPAVSAGLANAIVGINVLWVVASFGILLAGVVQPNLLGIAFVVAQALAVALFAALQVAGLRRGSTAAA
ncbi:MAG: hypothetical protein K5872_04315 [Rhizobiaceae bacterium]|nr:hypothetical protein [Rhizobiaceae bacterium]MCV0405435.1 hypothetical protein [Rhizobiaceae bacterium]